MTPPPSSPEGTTFARTFRSRLRRVHPPIDGAAVASLAALGAVVFFTRAPFVLQPAVPIELPSAPFEFGVAYDTLIVAVTRDGLMFVRDRRVSMEELQTEIRTAVGHRPDLTLLVQADRRVPHGTLVEIYTVAAAHGVKRVALAAAPGGTPPPEGALP